MSRPQGRSRTLAKRFLLGAALLAVSTIGANAQVQKYYYVGPRENAANLNNVWETAFLSAPGTPILRSISFEPVAPAVTPSASTGIVAGTPSSNYTVFQSGVKVTFSSTAGTFAYRKNANTNLETRNYGMDGVWGLNTETTTTKTLVIDFNGSLTNWIGFHTFDLENTNTTVKISGAQASGPWTELVNWPSSQLIKDVNLGNEDPESSWTFLGIRSPVAYSKYQINFINTGGTSATDLFQYGFVDGDVLYWNAASPQGLSPSGGTGVWNGGNSANTNWLTAQSSGSPIMFTDGKAIAFAGSTGGTVTLDISQHNGGSAGFRPSAIYFLPTGDASTYVIGATPNNGLISPQTGAFIEVQRDAVIRARINAPFEKTGLARLTVEGDNVATSAITLSQGVYQVGAGGLAGSQASDILNNSSLVFNRTGRLVHAHVISGGGTVEKQGDGTLVLTRNSTFTGLFTITGGAVDLGDASAEGAVVSEILNGALLRFNRSNDYVHGHVIRGTGAVEKLGSSTLTFTNENTYAGLTTVKGGTLQIGAGGTAGSVFGDVAVESGTSLVFNNSATKSYNGGITGAGSVTKRGAGVIQLGGTSDYAGLTVVETGRVELRNGAGLGAAGALSGTEVRSGATVQLRDGIITSEPFTISGLGDGAVGALRNVNDSNQIRGLVTLQDHAVVTSAAGVLNIWSVASADKDLTVNASASDDGTVILSQSLSLGAGRLIKAGDGILQVDAASAFTGGALIRRGEYVANSQTSLGQGGIVEVGESGVALQPTLTLGVDTNFNGTVQLSDGLIRGPGTLEATAFDFRKGEVSATLLGTLGLQKTSADAVILSGANQYQGETLVSGGILVLRNGAALGSVADATRVVSGGSLQLEKPASAAGITIAEQITIAGASNSGALRNFSGANSVTGALLLDGDATVYADGVSASKQSLRLGAVGDGTARVLTVEVESNATVFIGGPIDLGGGRIVKRQPGVLDLQGPNLTAASAQPDGVGLEILGGTVIARHASALGPGSVKVGDTAGSLSGTLNIGTTITTSATVRLDKGLISGGVLTAGLYDLRDGTVTASLGGTVGLSKTSTGTVVLSGSNFYTGLTSVEGGVLRVGSSGLGSSAGPGDQTVVGRSGSLELARGAVISGEQVVLSGDGQGGLGVLRTQGSATNYEITQGIVIDDVFDGTAVHARINNRAVGYDLKLSGVTGVAKDLIFGKFESQSLSAGDFLVTGGIWLATGRLVMEARGMELSPYGWSPASTLRLEGVGAYSGGTDIRSGVVVAAHPDALGSGPITVGSATRIGNLRTAAALNGLGNVTLVNGLLEGSFALEAPSVELQKGWVNLVLAGAGTVTKTTASTIELNKANTYTGSTLVSGGVLAVRNNLALGDASSGTTVQDGASVRLTKSRTTVSGESLSISGMGYEGKGALASYASRNVWSAPLSLSATSRIDSYSGVFTLSGADPIAGVGHDLHLGGTARISLQKALSLGGGALVKDGTGILQVDAPQTVAQVDHLLGTVDMRGHTLTAPNYLLDGAAGVSVLQGYGRIAGRVEVTDQVRPRTLISAGSTLAAPAPATLTLEMDELAFNGTGRLRVRGLRNYLVPGDIAVAGQVEQNLGSVPSPFKIAGDLSFDALTPGLVQINLRGARHGRTYQIAEFGGNLTATHSLLGPGDSITSLKVLGVRRGFRQTLSVRALENPVDARQFVTFSLTGDVLHWRGSQNDQWEINDSNWSLSSRLPADAQRLNLIVDDAVIFDDIAEGAGEVFVRVMPFGSAGSRRVATATFSNTAARDYTVRRDPDGAGDSPGLDAYAYAQQLHIGASGGVVNLLTKVVIDPDDADDDVPTNGVYLYGGKLRLGSDYALGGRLVEIEGGRMSSFGAGNRIFAPDHTLRVLADDIVFGEAGHEGRLSFQGAVELNPEGDRVLTVDAAAALQFGGDVIGGGIIKRGSGRLTLAGAAPFEGGLRVEEGVLEIGAGGSTGAATQDFDVVGNLSGMAELHFNRGGNRRADSGYLEITESIFAGTGTGADLGRQGGLIRKTGVGKVSLTGDTVAAGGIWVEEGNLALNAATHAGAVTVASGAILSGNGLVDGPVTLLSGGRHEPGNSPGRPVYGSLSYANASVVRWELTANDAAPALAGQPGGYDQIRVDGALSFSGNTLLELAFSAAPSAPLTSSVDWTDEFWGSGQRWTVFDVGGVTTGLTVDPATNYVTSGLVLDLPNSLLYDSLGRELSAVRDEAFFRLAKQGENILLVYTPYGSLVSPKPLDLGAAYVGDPFNVGTLTVRNIGADPANMSLVNLVNSTDATPGGPTMLVPVSVAGLDTGELSVGMTATLVGVNAGSVGVRVEGTLGVETESVNVSGRGIEQAIPVVAALDFGSARLSDPSKAYSALSGTALAHVNVSFESRAIRISNAADSNHGESMSASVINPSANLAVTGTVGTVLPGQTNESLTATLAAPVAAGVVNAGATLRTVSTKLLPDLPDRPSQTDQAFAAQGTAYYHAFGELTDAADRATIDFGRIRRGGSFATQTIEVRNDVSSGLYSESLAARIIGSNRVITSGSVDGLAPTLSDVASLTVTLDGSRVGRITGSATVVFATEPKAGSGLSLAEVHRIEIPVVGEVFGPARVDDSLFSLGRVHQNGSFAWQSLPVRNLTEDAAYTDDLKVDWVTSDPGLVKSGPARIENIVAGTADAALQVRIEDAYTTARGVYTKNVTLEGFSVPRDGSGEFSIGFSNIAVQGIVYSGQSAWTSGDGAWTNDSWSRWALTEGVPGRDAALSVNDSVTFAGNQPAVRTVTLTGYNPELARLAFGGTNGTILRSAAAEEILLGGNGLATDAEIDVGASVHRIETPINLKQDLVIRADGLQGLFYGAIRATDSRAKDVWLRGAGNIGLFSPLSGDTWSMNLTLQGPLLLAESQTLDALTLESGEVASPHLIETRYDPALYPYMSIAGVAAGQRVINAASVRKTTGEVVRIGVATQDARFDADPSLFSTLVDTIMLTGFPELSVEGGSLYNNGVIDAPVTVHSGATLGGVGRNGAVTVLSGGTFAPGNSIGWTNVASLVTNPGSTYQVEINGDSPPDSADRAIVASGGVVDLRGGIEVAFYPGVTANATDISLSTVFTIATFDVGTAVNLAMDPTNETDTTLNGVYFDSTTLLDYPSLTPMVRALPDRLELYFGLAANFGDPRTVSVLPSIMGRTSAAFVSSLTNDPYSRASVRGPSSASGVTGEGLLNAKNDLDQAVTGAQDGSWVNGYARAIDAKQGAPGWDYEYRLGGVAGGVDLVREDGWVAGVAVGTSRSDSTHEYKSDRTMATAYDVGLYSTAHGEGVAFNFAAFFSHYDVNHTRFTQVGIRNMPSPGRFDSYRAGLAASLVTEIHRTPASDLRLNLGLGGGLMHRDAYEETGDPAVAMNFDASNVQYFELDLGVSHSLRLGSEGSPWALNSGFTLSRRVATGDISVLGRFNDPSTGGEAPLLAPDYTFLMARPSIGVSWTKDSGRFSVELAGELRKGLFAPTLEVSMGYRF